jgi:hypothetical protein
MCRSGVPTDIGPMDLSYHQVGCSTSCRNRSTDILLSLVQLWQLHRLLQGVVCLPSSNKIPRVRGLGNGEHRERVSQCHLPDTLPTTTTKNSPSQLPKHISPRLFRTKSTPPNTLHASHCPRSAAALATCPRWFAHQSPVSLAF